MESRANTDHIEIKKTRRVKMSLVKEKTPDNGSTQQSLYKTLSHEDCEDFYNYLDWLDLASSSRTLVLPENKHFYYSAEDFQGLELLVNLECINKLSKHNYFLDTIYTNMPDYCYFTGCFQDCNKVREEKPSYTKYLEDNRKTHHETYNRASTPSRFTDKVLRFFDTETGISLNNDNTRELLRLTGFTILDMTELNGRTYFCVQKRPLSD